MSLVLILQVKQVQQTTVKMNLVNIIYLLQQYQIHGLLVIHQTIPLLFGVVMTDYKDPITTWEERRLPQKLFKSIMTELSRNVPNTKFEQPSSVVSATIEIGSEPLKLASEYTPADKKSTELFVRGTVPTQVSTEYEAVEIEPPFNLRAEYDIVGQAINLTWEHNNSPKRKRMLNQLIIRMK